MTKKRWWCRVFGCRNNGYPTPPGICDLCGGNRNASRDGRFSIEMTAVFVVIWLGVIAAIVSFFAAPGSPVGIALAVPMVAAILCCVGLLFWVVGS